VKTNEDIATNETAQRKLVLHIIQPGLAGLMDGSVSSLAPLFAAAYSTHNAHTTFIVGLATAAGAGISMAFSEALSDDGKLSGRGNPWKRGLASGLMTFAGAIGHTLPFLITNFSIAMMISSPQTCVTCTTPIANPYSFPEEQYGSNSMFLCTKPPC